MIGWTKPTAYQTRADVYSPVFSVTPTDKPGSSRYIFGLRQRKLSLFQATVESGDRFPVSSSDVALDVWTHVAVTHTGTDVKLYVNGVPDSTTATGSFLPPVTEYGNSHLTIGGYYSAESLNGNNNYTTARVFQGSLADIRVWAKARTAEEIAADCQSRLRGDEDGLLLYAPFDDANGTVAHDMVSGQSLVVPPTMQFVEDDGLTLSPPSAKLIGGGYLASTRTGGNSGASAIVTDVDFANKADGTGPDFTFETWLRVPGQFSDDQWIFSKYAESGDTGWIGLDIRSNTLTPEVVISGQRFRLAEPIEVDRWYHLAATRTGSSYAIYLDGAPATSGTCRTTGFSVDNAAAPVKLLNAGPNKSFGGDVREMRVWNVARTAAQIAAYYDKAATGREEGLVGCWHMDDGVPLLAAPDLGEESEQAANFGGGWFSVARTGIHVDAADFTFETWVRPDAYPFDQSYLFAQYKEGESNPSRFLMGFHDTGRFGFFIGGTDGSGNAGGWKETDEAIPLGRWTHLAATRSGSTLKLYVNGVLAKTFENYTTLSPWSSDHPHDLTLGGVNGNYAYSSGNYLRNNISRSFAGAMRDARVWKVARSAEEIGMNYNRRVYANERGLVGYWPLDGADAGGATRLANKHGNAVGSIIAGWETVEPIRLKDPTGPFILVVR